MDKHRLLEDIARDGQQDPQFFEEVIEHIGISPRNLMQMYMMYKFKWNWQITGPRAHNETAFRWVDSGMAKAYAELYDENLSVTGMYRRLVKYEREQIERTNGE